METFEFSAAPPAEPVLEALDVLREMNASGKRKVPDDAPTSFVRPSWERHVFGEDGGIDKRYYEMSAVTELRNGLKSGDVWVPESRKYADFEDYLLPRSSWERMRSNGGPSRPVILSVFVSWHVDLAGDVGDGLRINFLRLWEATLAGEEPQQDGEPKARRASLAGE